MTQVVLIGPPGAGKSAAGFPPRCLAFSLRACGGARAGHHEITRLLR